MSRSEKSAAFTTAARHLDAEQISKDRFTSVPSRISTQLGEVLKTDRYREREDASDIKSSTFLFARNDRQESPPLIVRHEAFTRGFLAFE